MAKSYYSTTLELDHAWHLPRAALSALDAALESSAEALARATDKLAAERASRVRKKEEGRHSAATVDQLAKAAESEVRQYLDVKRSIVVTCDTGKKLRGVSFEELMRVHPDIERDLPVTFIADLEGAGITVQVQLWRHSGLDIAVRPESSDAAREIFLELRSWAMSFRLPMRDRLYLALGSWLWVPALLVLGKWLPGTVSSAEHFKAQARELLAKPVATPVDEAKAIQLLLSLAADMPAPGGSPVTFGPPWILILSMLLIAASALAFVSRRHALGIGPGERYVANQALVRKVLLYGIPGFAVATFLLPWALRLSGVTH